MANTKSEYLRSLQSKADKVQRRKTPFGRIRILIVCAILCIGSWLGVKHGTEASAEEQLRSYEDFRTSANVMVSPDELNYEDTFEIWNSRDIGNDVNTLLSGGEILTREAVRVAPSDDFSSMNVVPLSGDSWNIPVPGSSLNSVGNTLFFRNDLTRDIHAVNLTNTENTVLYEGNVGEVFVSNNRVYYIDFDNGYSIMSMNLNGEDNQKLIEGPIQSFAIIGDAVIYLNTNQSLFRAQLDNPAESAPLRLVDNIERFFIGPKIYAESKNTIFSFSLDGKNAEELYTSVFNDLRMVGYQDGRLYFQEDGALRYLNDGAGATVCADKHILYSSLSYDFMGGLTCIGYIDSHSKEILTVFLISEPGGVENGE